MAQLALDTFGGLDRWPTFAIRVAVTTVLTLASWRLLERQPAHLVDLVLELLRDVAELAAFVHQQEERDDFEDPLSLPVEPVADVAELPERAAVRARLLGHFTERRLLAEQAQELRMGYDLPVMSVEQAPAVETRRISDDMLNKVAGGFSITPSASGLFIPFV